MIKFNKINQGGWNYKKKFKNLYKIKTNSNQNKGNQIRKIKKMKEVKLRKKSNYINC